MGRYYNGDIEGKFWFGIQSSTAADRFGVSGTQNYVDYYFSDEDLPAVKEELELIKKNLGEYKKKIDTFFSGGRSYTHQQLAEYLGVDEQKVEYLLSEYADLRLGTQIEKCIEENGECYFRAEL